jgi:hypothetical protein
MIRRTGAAFAVAVGLMAVVVSGALAAASVGTLNPAVMHGHEAPSGFASNNFKVFLSFNSTMTVAGQTCSAGSIRRGDWKQGFHQVLKKPWPPTIDVDLLDVCGYLFTTDGPAINYFVGTLGHVRQSVASGGAHAIRTPKIGDEVLAAYAPPRNGSGVYVGVFRYRNALIGITYIYYHKPLMTTAAFVRLLQQMGKRLQVIHR